MIRRGGGGAKNDKEGKQSEDKKSPKLDDNVDMSEAPPDGVSPKNEDLADHASKKLKGTNAVSLCYPALIRYKRLSDRSAVIRQWEEQILGSSTTSGYKTRTHVSSNIPPILASRIFFSRAKSYPMMVHSIIKYDAGEEKAKIKKLRAEDHKGLEVFGLEMRDWRGLSYKPLFKPIMNKDDPAETENYSYDPSELDDPDMLHGSHRYVLQRSTSTLPILGSIILFVNKQELKQSLNEQFRERHPTLPPSLTLSRIRTVKKAALLQCLSCGIEVATVAIAVINFERLCLKNYVTKINRKLAMAVSLTLAYKFNECNSFSRAYLDKLVQLLDFFDREWHLSKRQVFDAEFGAFVHLGFSLHVPYQHIHMVFARLLKLVHLEAPLYLGEDMFDMYVTDVMSKTF